ncbi:hypothetical protein SAMN05428957_102518 [Oryzisolibacter propanilivorax]|uniref:Uncharacterized protein n=1 Tax=Oryzisolibacter propanilivorax TaxID=1527607 RepID=A0A1G9QRG6_9BURK|nr:hypothetical protein SAMN05428957_102518 [Oryzisolibacter propanilivorax]
MAPGGVQALAWAATAPRSPPCPTHAPGNA